MTKRLTVFYVLIFVSALANAREWEVLRPFHEAFDLDLSNASLDVSLKGEDDKVLYFISCRAGDGEVPPGGLWCTLNNRAGDMESSLLAEDDSPAWHTRGNFTPSALTGDCGNYPEFGKHRSFRLRGFQLNIDVSEIVFNDQQEMQRLRLSIDVKPDVSATGESAEQPGYMKPKFNQCLPVREGNDPRMCRDWENAGGSWTECSKIGR